MTLKPIYEDSLPPGRLGRILKAVRALDAAPVHRRDRMFYKDGVWYKTDRRGRAVDVRRHPRPLRGVQS